MDVQGELRGIAAETAKKHGLFLVEAGFNINAGTYQIRIVVDKNGGVLIEDCAKINRALNKYIEETQILNDNFSIEVTSPGIDRNFSTIDDFIGAIGRRINVTTRQSIGEDNSFCAAIIAAADDEIKLLTDGDKELTLNLNNIKKAKLEIRWKK